MLALIDALRHIDSLAAIVAKRMRRGLTRIAPIRRVPAPLNAAPSRGHAPMLQFDTS